MLDKEGSIEIDLFSLTPILLTEDILLKCGFEKHVEEYSLNNQIIFYTLENDYKDIEMVLIKSSHEDSTEIFYSYLHYSPNSKNIEKDKDKIPKIHIKNLHHLQNLYYDLIGCELDVKL